MDVISTVPPRLMSHELDCVRVFHDPEGILLITPSETINSLYPTPQ